MKLKKICLAVASAIAAGASAQAPALTLEQFDGTTVNVFTAGSTALDGAIRSYMRYICQNKVDEFQATVTQPVTPGIYANNNVLQSMYFCTLSTNAAIVTNAALRGQKLLIRKSSGDSGEGVVVGGGALAINFLANPAVVSTTSVNNVSNYTCTSGASTAASGSLGSIQQWSCGAFGTTTSTTGPAGFADVEFSLLNQIITPKVPAATINGNLTNYGIAANVWGVTVSKNLRDALQTVQGLPVGDDNEAFMPSLPKTVLTSLFTGSISDWSLLTDNANVALTTRVAPASANTGVFLARRPDSSGTQTSFRAMLLNSPCATTANFLPDNTGGVCGTAVAGATSVTVNQGTGNLLSCLGTLNTQGKYGIGFASSTNRPIANFGATNQTDAGWRYIKVGGVAPTLFNASQGRYDLLTEATLAYQTTGAQSPSGNPKALLDEMGTQLGQPTVLAAVNSGNAVQNYASTVWYAGVMTPGSNIAFSPTYPLSVAGVNGNPVLPTTRGTLGANSCQPVIVNSIQVPIQTQ